MWLQKSWCLPCRYRSLREQDQGAQCTGNSDWWFNNEDVFPHLNLTTEATVLCISLIHDILLPNTDLFDFRMNYFQNSFRFFFSEGQAALQSLISLDQGNQVIWSNQPREHSNMLFLNIQYSLYFLPNLWNIILWLT